MAAPREIFLFKKEAPPFQAESRMVSLNSGSFSIAQTEKKEKKQTVKKGRGGPETPGKQKFFGEREEKSPGQLLFSAGAWYNNSYYTIINLPRRFPEQKPRGCLPVTNPSQKRGVSH